MPVRSSAKDLILNAAEAVVTELGAAHLTLDAVAQRAAVSKGGLLYHFPSKELLLQAMLHRLIGEFDETKAEILSRLPAGPSADLRAHLLASFACLQKHKRISAAILAAGANDPKLLNPIRERNAHDVARISAGEGRVALSLVILLAIDGLFLNELLDTMVLDAELREQVMNELLTLAGSATSKSKVTP